MRQYTMVVGLDQAQFEAIASRTDSFMLLYNVPPAIVVHDGTLHAQAPNSSQMVPIERVVYHGIYESDLDFITGLALWGGPCLPNARAMMDCRLKLPCLVRALGYSRYSAPARGFASPHTRYTTDSVHVAKWGNWHCGDNKARFDDTWQGDAAAVIEPFMAGEAQRVVMIGERTWQIRMSGDDWLKSIHHDDATLIPLDADLHADTIAVRDGFGLDLIANDYIVGPGGPHLLETNHIPNVTRFAPIWQAYEDWVCAWLEAELDLARS